MDSEPLLPTHGGYRSLKTFQAAQLVYDLTARFAERYVGRRSRTHDQMIQAARSGVQNISKRVKASGTSKKAEIRAAGWNPRGPRVSPLAKRTLSNGSGRRWAA